MKASSKLLVMMVVALVVIMLAPTATSAHIVATVHIQSPVVIKQLGKISRCPGQNAEVEQAADPANGYIYEEWMGCHNSIAFARSTDGGQHFSTPFVLPLSGGGAWDPALAVAPNGTLYVAFMQYANHHTFPVVEASFDHGRSFPQVRELIAPGSHNFGDREFIAVGPDGTIYLTWVYGPNNKIVKERCFKNGSCTTIAGDLNEVIQISKDNGRTWGPIIHISPGYPASGADTAEIVVEPNDRINVEYQGYQVLNHKNYKFGPAHSYYTSSVDGGLHWSTPVLLGPPGLTMSVNVWWIDGDIGLDAGGNLYATWDTQVHGEDVGWLTYSTDHGVHWSPLQRVTPDHDNAVHIVQVVGAQPGVAYVGWLADNAPQGYAMYLRPFSIAHGWLSQPIQVSTIFGKKDVWPGDTFGISTLPFGSHADNAAFPPVLLSWGSATNKLSEIFAAIVTCQFNM